MKITGGICFLFLLSCNAGGPETGRGAADPPAQTAFVQYLKQEHQVTGSNTPAYYLLVSSKQCQSCVQGNLSRFHAIKGKLAADNLQLISDYPAADSVLMGISYSRFLPDPGAQFMAYDFPKSYVSIYKVQGDSVAAYASLEDEAAFETFLAKEFR